MEYADDTLIFCVEEELAYLIVIWVLLEGISLAYLMEKEFILINEVHNLEALNMILAGEIGVLPTTYLGF